MGLSAVDDTQKQNMVFGKKNQALQFSPLNNVYNIFKELDISL